MGPRGRPSKYDGECVNVTTRIPKLLRDKANLQGLNFSELLVEILSMRTGVKTTESFRMERQVIEEELDEAKRIIDTHTKRLSELDQLEADAVTTEELRAQNREEEFKKHEEERDRTALARASLIKRLSTMRPRDRAMLWGKDLAMADVYIFLKDDEDAKLLGLDKKAELAEIDRFFEALRPEVMSLKPGLTLWDTAYDFPTIKRGIVQGVKKWDA